MTARRTAVPAHRRPWSETAIRGLGIRTDVPTAGAILAGVSSTQAYEMHKRGEFPVPVVRVGRRLVVPTSGILALLGLDGEAAGAVEAPTADDSPDAPAPRGQNNARAAR